MRKILTTLLCAILFVVVVLSMTACGGSSTQKQIDDLQDKLTQQQTKLNEMEETLKKLVKPVPFENTQYAMISGTWKKGYTGYLIDSQEKMQQMLDDFDDAFKSEYKSEWSFSTDDGTEITKEFFQEKPLDFFSPALIVSIFSSSSGGIYIEEFDLWKSSDVLHVEIDYTHTGWQMVSYMMVIMEVERQYVYDVNNVILDVNRISRWSLYPNPTD